MVTSQSKWPPDGTLTSVPVTLSGIRGDSDSLSMEVIKTEGLEGHIAKIRPFVVRTNTPIVIWGRDILSPWGMCLEMDF